MSSDIVRLIRLGNSVETAARSSGASSSDLSDWIRWGSRGKAKLYREFVDSVLKAEAEAEARNVLKITSAAKNDWRAAECLLNRRRKKIVCVSMFPRRQENGKRIPKAQRLRMITLLMAANQWVTGITGGEMADHLGFSLESINKDATEASRMFLEDPELAQERKAVWIAKIQSAQGTARSANRLDSLSRLLELEGKGQGFLEPAKIEVTGKEGEPIEIDARDGLVEKLAGLVASAATEGEAGQDNPQPEPGGG